MASTVAVASGKWSRPLQKTVEIYWKEAKYEFLKRWRMPVYSLSVVLFPAMFYTLFGLILNKDLSGGHKEAATYLLATMGCYGIIGVALFGFGVGVATERGQGWLEVKRASPMPIPAYFAGRVAMCMLFSFIVFLTLFTLGVTFGGVRLAPGQAIGLIATLVFGSIPFCAFGLVIGYFAKPNSAPAIVNMLYLPLSFLSGLWMPIWYAAQLPAEAGDRAAAVSSRPAGSAHGGLRQPRRCSDPPECADRLYADLPGSGDAGLSAG